MSLQIESDAPPAPTRSPPGLRQRVEGLRLHSNVQAGKRASARLAWGACLVLLAVIVWLAYAAFGPGRPAALVKATNPAKPAEASAAAGESGSAKSVDAGAAAVKAAAPPADGQLALESKGYIIPTKQILVSPQVSGRLTQVNFEEGQRIAQGEVLAQIETTEYQADYDRAVAQRETAEAQHLELQAGSRPDEITQAQAELAEARAQLKQIANSYQRHTELLNNRAISREEFDSAESQYFAHLRRIERLSSALRLVEEGPRQERIAAAAADLRRADAEVAKAKWRLDNCTVRSPIAGTVLRKNAEEGNIVNPVAFNGSFSLCEMADLADLEVDLNIQERDISRIYKGQPCLVRADAFPQRVYRGHVSRLMPIADRAKGAVPVRVKLEIPAEEEGVYLKPEMGAVVSFYQTSAPPTAGGSAVSDKE
ncbi:MAG: efflux RND transporter periplasmic adaptor subunit [Planctomycetales bacterium]|nr:efflux RND transporter periplasmic adaptor subunit [Planctomycetales bacterium]